MAGRGLAATVLIHARGAAGSDVTKRTALPTHGRQRHFAGLARGLGVGFRAEGAGVDEQRSLFEPQDLFAARTDEQCEPENRKI